MPRIATKGALTPGSTPQAPARHQQVGPIGPGDLIVLTRTASEQDHAGHDLHPERVDAQQVEAVADEVDEQRRRRPCRRLWRSRRKRLVLPSTVAAITSSSNMMPAFGDRLPSRAVAMIRRERRHEPDRPHRPRA